MERKEKLAYAKDELGLELKGNISNDELDEKIEEAEMLAKDAKAMKPKEPVEDGKVVTKDPVIDTAKQERAKKAAAIKNSTIMEKAIVTPLAQNMREIPSEMYSHLTKNGTKKQVIKFGKAMPIYKCILDMLDEKQALVQVKTTNNKGKEVTVKQLGKAFMIQRIPLTEEEIAELTSK